MVKIYDEKMKEVFMPKDEDLHYGSYPLELILSSIQTERSGRKTIPVARSASLRVFIIASRHSDMDLKISRIFDFFRSLGVFYVAKDNEPFKLLKVEVNSEYTPDIGNTALTEFEIPLTVHKPYFKQSHHTTSDIDSEGVRWNDKWGYGMGLSSEREKWKYSFEPSDTNSTVHKFRFYNAGTEEVKLIQQKESSILLRALSSAAWVEIYDGETTFRLDRTLINGSPLTLKGHQIRVNNANVMHQTNRNFLTIKKGWNEWEIRGITNFEFDIDFRFLYD